MIPRIKEAEYLEQVLPEYRDNPLIEALPDIMSDSDTLYLLTKEPAYSPKERNMESRYRLHCIARLLNDYYQPLPQHLDIETKISICLRQGYRNRNPLGRGYALMANESFEAMKEKRYPRLVPGYHPNTAGFTIIGVSGVGKSTAVESILHLYPQVILHREYKGQPLHAKQIVWLKLDCPHDGSRGELCYRFFKAVDDLVGTEYLDQYKKSRITIDSMLTLMQRIAQEFSLGLLVVDEVQHLSLAKGGSDAMLNFFVTLENTIGVPVVLIGTSKALPLLQGQFRQARRASGHGALIWNRMKKERSWITFVQSMWKYQWTRNEVKLTPQMLDVVYEETQGIIVLAVALYVLIQEDAIQSARETFTIEDIRRISRERMSLVQPMLEALRKNDQKEIDKYEDITEILMDDIRSNLSQQQQAMLEAKTKTSAKQSFNRVHDEVLDILVKMNYPPEKMEPLIEQAYRKTKSTEFATILSNVLELTRRAASAETTEEKGSGESKELENRTYTGLSESGLVDDVQW